MEAAKIRIANARDNAEAVLIRSILGAHGISAVVSGEQHASMFPGVAGGFISLDVWVDREDAERAAELVAQLRTGTPEVGPGDDDDDEEPPSPIELSARDADLAGDEDIESDRPIRHDGIESRRRTGVVLLLAFCVTFGTAHMYARAWLRGMMLAGLEVMGFLRMGSDPQLGTVLLVGAILGDLIGALVIVRRQPRDAGLPTAHLRR